MIDEHSKLTAGGDPNWVRPYQSSVDLRATLLKDLRSGRPDLLLEGLLARDAVPNLLIECTGRTDDRFDLRVTNAGGVEVRLLDLEHEEELHRAPQAPAATAGG